MEKTNKPCGLILPRFLNQCSLIPHCSSLPMNQSKTISGKEMLEKYTKNTLADKIDTAGTGTAKYNANKDINIHA